MTNPQLNRALEAIANGGDVDAPTLHALRTADPATGELIEQIADRVSRLRRRDSQFRAVVAMTHDLTDTSDTDLLERIVARAHDLLGCDVTYISAYDAESETLSVRAVEGASSPDYLGMLVPRGVGVATQVVHKRGPVWVNDYRQATGFPRDTVIDAMMETEQISSILGVPLIADDSILGVLFVADRRARRYSPEDIGLARSFADHAAIVLKQSELIHRLHKASERAERDRARAEAHSMAMSRVAAVTEELTRLIAAGETPEALAQALSGAMGRTVVVIDAEGNRIAGDAALLKTAELAHVLPRLPDAEGFDLDEGPIAYASPMMVGHTVEGAILLERTAIRLSQADRWTLERAGSAFALMWAQNCARELADERLRTELAHSLITSAAARDHSLERVRALGLNPQHPWTVAHFAASADTRERVRQFFRASTEVLLCHDAGALWALSPHPALTAKIDDALEAAGTPRLLTVTHRGDTLAAVLDECATVRSVRAFLSGLGQHAGTHAATAFAPYAVLFNGSGHRAAAFVDELLAPVIDWDRRRGTQLFDTLRALLDAQGSPAGTARALNLHPNTVRQRLERISSLLPFDWSQPEARFRLEAAVRLEAARRSTARPRRNGT